MAHIKKIFKKPNQTKKTVSLWVWEEAIPRPQLPVKLFTSCFYSEPASPLAPVQGGSHLSSIQMVE